MINYLVVFLSFNRCMLILVKYDQRHVEDNRICINTKYLTLFLFCMCTIANVFRLELLNLNLSTSHDQKLLNSLLPDEAKAFDNNVVPSAASMSLTGEQNKDSMKSLDFIFKFLVENEKSKSSIECGPNLLSISFSASNASNNWLFWRILIYNLLFTCIPLALNSILCFYLIKKRAELQSKLIELTEILYKIKSKYKSASIIGNQKAASNFVSEFFFYNFQYLKI
jgi:hypothetical protein